MSFYYPSALSSFHSISIKGGTGETKPPCFLASNQLVGKDVYPAAFNNLEIKVADVDVTQHICRRHGTSKIIQ
jgi:hypothetical protein